MSAMEPLSYLIGFSTKNLSKEENFILEAVLFTYTCDELREIYRNKYKEYFQLMKYTIEQENTMLENNFVRLIIRDILFSEEYTLDGIALYTDTPQDIIQEIFSGYNISPSAKLLRRIIELHRSVRRDLYHAVIKKMIVKYSAIA